MKPASPGPWRNRGDGWIVDAKGNEVVRVGASNVADAAAIERTPRTAAELAIAREDYKRLVAAISAERRKAKADGNVALGEALGRMMISALADKPDYERIREKLKNWMVVDPPEDLERARRQPDPACSGPGKSQV